MRKDFGSVCLLVAGCVVALLAAVAVAAPAAKAPASKADKSGTAAKPDKPAKPTKPAQKTPYEPTSHYTIMNMEGWKVYVNKALLPGGAHAEMGAKAIERLRGDMVLVKHSWTPPTVRTGERRCSITIRSSGGSRRWTSTPASTSAWSTAGPPRW
jgi:hypothetical protein